MARKKKAIPLPLRRQVIERDRGYCRYCGKRGAVHRWVRSSWISIEHEIDHVFPESRGGKMALEILVVACRRCNRRKGIKTLKEAGMRLIPLRDMIWQDEE